MSIKEKFEALSAGESLTGVDVEEAIYESLPAVTEHNPQQLIGRSLNNRYVLESLIGQGTTSWVFKARDIRKVEACSNQPYVAIKVLNLDLRGQPEASVGLEREAARSQQLNHPNIVAVYDFDRDGGLFYLVMEWLNGPSLDSFIRGLTPRERRSPKVRDIISSLISALSFAHQKGIVHSDFKPANVILDENGQPRVLDYGVARMTYAVVQPHGWTSGFQGYTPTYASWKRLKGGHASVEDDTYALACVIYELLTGKHPYGRRPATEARQAGLRVRRPRGLEAHAWKLLKQALDTEGTKVPRLSELAEAFGRKATGAGSPRNTVGMLILVALLTLGINLEAVSRWITAAGYHLSPRSDFLLNALHTRSGEARESLWQLVEGRVMAELDQVLQEYKQQDSLEALMTAWTLAIPLLELVSDQTELAEAGAWLEAERIRELYRNYLVLNRFSSSPVLATLSTDSPSTDSPLAVAFRRVQMLAPQHPVLVSGRWRSQLHEELERALIQGRWSDAMTLVEFAMNLLPEERYWLQVRQRLMLVGEENGDKEWPEPPTLDHTPVYRAMVVGLMNAGLLNESRRELRQWIGLVQEAHKPELIQGLQKSYKEQLQSLPAALRPTAQSHGVAFFAGLALDKVSISQAEDEFREAVRKMMSALERNTGVDAAVRDVSRQLDRLIGNTESLERARSYLESSLKQQLTWYDSGSSAFARFNKTAQVLLPDLNWQATGRRSHLSCQDVPVRSGLLVSLCRDRIESYLMGPELVLVSDLQQRRAFYLSRTEVQVGDYNLYCRMSLDCHPRSGPENLPLTEVSYAEANRYSRWLSQTTGQHYRIPRLQEWRLAAEQGQALSSCTSGGGLQTGKQGLEDQLGILHLAGNVREFVLDGRQLRVQGGNVWDEKEKCSVTLGGVHYGRPDRLTGFRLVREVH